jgi:polyvinyl alcohol dehydrogenase (cytochrome)
VTRAIGMILALGFAALPATASADWLMYGHDISNSRSAGASGPRPAAASRLTEAWRFEAPGGFFGTPVVRGRTLIAGSYTGEGAGTVYALDTDGGGLRWTYDLSPGDVNGSVAVSDGRVYVPVYRYKSPPRLLALRLSDGTLAWEAVLDTQPGADVYGSPVPWRGRVYIGTSGGDAEQFYGPTLDTRGSVMALDAATGRRVWKTYAAPPGFNGAAVWTTPAIDSRRNRLYVGTGNALHAPVARTTDAILALDTRSGRILDHFQATHGDRFTVPSDGPGPDFDFGSSPNLFVGPGGQRLVGELQKNRVYWALDRRTLRRVWKKRVGTRGPKQDALASTAYRGHRIYGQTINGQVWALSRAGRKLWTSRPDGESNYSPLAVAHGVIYNVSARGVLNARRATTGRRLARLALGSPAWGGVAVAGGSVLVGTGTNETPAGYVVAYRVKAAAG